MFAKVQDSQFTVCGQDALFVARTFYKTQAVVRYVGGSEKGLAYVSLLVRGQGSSPSPSASSPPLQVHMNRSLTEGVLRELLVDRADYSVEWYEKMQSGQWKLQETASPGRLGQLEDFVYRTAEMAEVPVVMAITLQYMEGARTVGAAFADPNSRRQGRGA